jgi:hypothetical protein
MKGKTSKADETVKPRSICCRELTPRAHYNSKVQAFGAFIVHLDRYVSHQLDRSSKQQPYRYGMPFAHTSRRLRQSSFYCFRSSRVRCIQSPLITMESISNRSVAHRSIAHCSIAPLLHRFINVHHQCPSPMPIANQPSHITDQPSHITPHSSPVTHG